LAWQIGLCLAYISALKKSAMKHFYLIAALILFTTAVFAQDYYETTAIKSGKWSDNKVWSVVARKDGKKLNSIAIPKNITIQLDENADMSDYGTSEISVFGTLEMKSNKSIVLSKESKVVIGENGTIELHSSAKKDKKDKKIEQIIIGDVVKFDGANETSLTGYAVASSLTGASPFGFSSNATLPVNFVSFNAAKANDQMVTINFTTSDEVNNSHFEIQRSVDGINWTNIAVLFPANDGGNIHLYKYNDKFAVKSAVYYRIRQVDMDGKYKFSSVKLIGGTSSNQDTKIFVSAKNTVTVDLVNVSENNVMVRLISMNGTVVNQVKNVAAQRITIGSGNLSAGAYVVQVTGKSGLISSRKVLL